VHPSMGEVRIEKDSLGPREVPAGAYYGIQTLRAHENFPVSGLRSSRQLLRAYGELKRACARANVALGVLDPTLGAAIEQAAREVAKGEFDGEFIVDVFQAGAGTSLHMNVNEVIANRALEICGAPRGEYSRISPNDHVNRAQSTNDTYPSAVQVALLWALSELRPAVESLAGSLERKGHEFAPLAKAGRTHLKDAMPVTLGGELTAYGTVLRHVVEELPSVQRALAELPLGGSAVGTGINTAEGFRTHAVRLYAEGTGLPLTVARDPLASMQSRWALGVASGWLRSLAQELGRIANDLRLLGSGPATGFDELHLPEIQPGSSIMPAKVNPSAAECLNMVAFHVLGADAAASLAVQAGQLEINVMVPLIGYELLFSCQILTNYLPVFARSCIDGITANPARLEQYLMGSMALATILTPKFGYLKVAELIHESERTHVPVKELLLRHKLLSPQEAEALLGPAALLKLAQPQR
jgi:aspartate ammonia-lyase